MEKIFIFLLFLGRFIIAQNPLLQGDSELFFYQDAGNNMYKLTPIISGVWDNNGLLKFTDRFGHSVLNPIPLDLAGTITKVTSNNGMDYINSVGGSTVSIFANSLYKLTCIDKITGNENAFFFLISGIVIILKEVIMILLSSTYQQPINFI